jgi:hypothetical protein
MLSYGVCSELQLAVISSYLSMPNNPKSDNGIMTVWLQVSIVCADYDNSMFIVCLWALLSACSRVRLVVHI